jgi:cytochrome subunit of sulfide dehydrogenase
LPASLDATLPAAWPPSNAKPKPIRREDTMRISCAVSALFAAATMGAGLALPAAAQDANQARSLAATCFTCHGTDGRSVDGIPPSLAGQNKDYLLTQLKEFKAGTRPATIMQQHAKGYTDEQLALIAGYFASRKAGPGTPAPAPSVSRMGY